MQLVSDSNKKWYVTPSYPTDGVVSGTVAKEAKAPITTSSNNTTNGTDVTVNPDADFAAAMADLGETLGLTFSATQLEDLQNSLFEDMTWDSSSNTFVAVGTGDSISTLDTDIDEVFIKNGIYLASASSSSTDEF